MWYDFSIAQTRFNGDVQLSYISGADLMQVRDDLQMPMDTALIPAGRSTFLACEQLTVDFALAQDASSGSKNRSIGGLSTDRLKQFEARYGVVLQDSAEGLNLTAERIVFRKDSCLLSIHGTNATKAHIVKKRPGQLPHQVSVKHLFYNTCTGEIEVSEPHFESP